MIKFVFNFLIPRIKIFRELKEQITLLYELEKATTELNKKEEEELRDNFILMCPNCSKGMLVSKKYPKDSNCYNCGTQPFKELE